MRGSFRGGLSLKGVYSAQNNNSTQYKPERKIFSYNLQLFDDIGGMNQYENGMKKKKFL